ncbi:zinc ABC transporter solute-binding protein [Microvirga tunisiensis]|uniref:Zinc ABC transporter solute-binding protein n=2 Tax=Pannonibacter tanglangensis TaxID=2750084 RepID=A0ABW9ZJW7_9HYPH|nr:MULTISPECIES: zinc ABC transporter substrate-binding protein [unclassified Pannonibacter]NBN65185.1 zinc ABC transporter solute-binding protein [Pannonibacter sp. XCT-34]NBN79838.1 zinc ABC transporter solute-binding protein [Pannonibacter sp. XCT-53]
MALDRRNFLKATVAATALATVPAVSLVSSGPALAAAPAAAPAAGALTVVTTTGMIADAARRVGGEAVSVTSLMGPGVDPHAYRQTRTDIVAMTRADLVLWHGLYLEAQMEDFFADLGRKRQVVAVADGLDRARLLSHADYAGRFDPHVWMDPMLWSGVVIAVRDALTAARPGQAPLFAANAEAHLAELAGLDAYSRQVLGTVPEASRVLLTAHDAFGYFGRAYGYEVIGIQGISTQSEAGLNRVAELVDLLVSRKIGAVFVESSVSDRNIRALIEGAASRGHAVTIGGELFSDAMGQSGTYEGTYLGMIDHNVTLVARALGGTAPARGMNGTLSAGL